MVARLHARSLVFGVSVALAAASSPLVARAQANGPGTRGARAAALGNAAVALAGADVYVAGYEQSGNTSVATVWKNGAATALTDGTREARAYALVLAP